MAISEHKVINYDKKYEARLEWRKKSKGEKLQAINRRLFEISVKRQVILRDFSKRFTEEGF